MRSLLALSLLLIPSFLQAQVRVEKLAFAMDTDLGSQVVALSSFGGTTPTAVILWGTNQTVTGEAVQDSAFCFGFSDGTNDACAGAQIEDGVATSNVKRHHSDAHIFRSINSSGTVTEALSVTSFAADQITFNVDTNGSALLLQGLAIGGDSDNAAVITGDTATSNGTVDYTGAGFQPTAAFVISIGTGTTPPAVTDNVNLSIGYTDGTSEVVSAIGAADAGATAAYERRQLTTACLLAGYNLTDTIGVDTASFDAWLADGIRLDYTATDVSARKVFILCLEGANYEVGADTAETVGLPTTKSTTTADEPKALIVTNIRGTASADEQAEVSLLAGVADSSTAGSAAAIAGKQEATDEAAVSNVNDQVIQTTNAAASVVEEAARSSFNATDFTLRLVYFLRRCSSSRFWNWRFLISKLLGDCHAARSLPHINLCRRG